MRWLRSLFRDSATLRDRTLRHYLRTPKLLVAAALQPILFTYPATRLSGAALAGGIAFVNTIGLCGGFLGPYVMGFMQDATGSKLSGLWFIVAMCIIGALLSLLLKRGAEKPETVPAAH